MRIFHSSDLHGDVSRLRRAADFDVWLDTGDFFPNLTRGVRPTETRYQPAWWQLKAEKRVLQFLQDRPVITVPGNHDFVSLADLLKAAGHTQVYEVTAGVRVELGGERFAGYREIPWIAGEWVGEEHELRRPVGLALDQDPTILVTHAPPHGILDGTDAAHIGVSELTSWLFYKTHHVRHHFFGHKHLEASSLRDVVYETENGPVHFHNGACAARVVDTGGELKRP